jgi:putative transposase
MPSKNVIKLYLEGGHYHIYNRGVGKRTIFIDDQDYRTFLNCMITYLMPAEENQRWPHCDIHEDIELLAYCLMPNHFHLLVKQGKKEGISEFMKCLLTKYSIYFNKKYDRVGTLFQGTYKGALIEADEYLIYLSRYIHLNPKAITNDVKTYDYSSLKYYLSSSPIWLKRGLLGELFSTNKEYFDYLKMGDSKSEQNALGDLMME